MLEIRVSGGSCSSFRTWEGETPAEPKTHKTATNPRLSRSFALPKREEATAWEGEAPAEPEVSFQFSVFSNRKIPFPKGSTPLVLESTPPHRISRGALALTRVLWQQPPRRDASSPHSEFELSWAPGHTPAVDGDSRLPFPLA